MAEPRVLESTGNPVGGLVKAALSSLKSGEADSFEGLTYRRPATEMKPDDVRKYADVCGFPRKDTVPLTYPHMVAFPLHMAIMTDSDFPYPAIGTVHVENSITAHRALGVGEAIAVEVSVGTPQPHAKGVTLDFVTSAKVDGEEVWTSTSTYLRRGKGTDAAPRGMDLPEVERSPLTWQLPGDLGRQYAAVSGDHNPIHLYPLTAKALGFPRQIAHGMWSKARCVAAIENRLPEAVTVDVAFKKPIVLPGTVSFSTAATESGRAFALHNPKNDAPHLRGLARAVR